MPDGPDFSTVTGRPRAHEWDRWVDPDDFSALCFALDGSANSWVGDFLRLVAKSDPAHRARLRLAAPAMVAAWETWNTRADGHGRGVIEAHRVWETFVPGGW